ncbi:hypothetical protein [Marinobacter sp.]|uniref:hypothetical protein n=1 Tax=Marinobacter sp. TaxID=50741 RepID=UPI003567CEF9
MTIRYGLPVLVALVLLPSLTAAQDVVARLKGNGLEESFTEEASVSGRVVAGVLAGSATASDALALYASAARSSNDICVRVISRDGLYWSENTFTWPKGADASLVPLQYQSRYREQLARYDARDLAILGYEGDCQQVPDGPLLVAARGTDADRPSTLDILVNSGRSDTFAVLTNLVAGPQTIACQAITAGRRTGYDTVCTVPLMETSEDGLLEVRIMRRRFDRMMPATTLVVHLPGNGTL